jgi:hypothetical protein
MNNSSLIILAIVLFFWLLLGVVMGLLAIRKGYSFGAWFLTGGFVLLGAIGLGFMPNARDQTKSPEERDRILARGNRIGLILSGITALLGFLSLGLQSIVWELIRLDEDSPHSSYVIYNSFHKLLHWLQFLFFAMVLAFYLTKPPRQRSVLVTLALLMMPVMYLGYILLPLLNDITLNSPSDFMNHVRMMIYVGLHLASFVALILLGIGVLQLQRGAPAPEPEQAWVVSTK